LVTLAINDSGNMYDRFFFKWLNSYVGEFIAIAMDNEVFFSF